MAWSDGTVLKAGSVNAFSQVQISKNLQVGSGAATPDGNWTVVGSFVLTPNSPDYNSLVGIFWGGSGLWTYSGTTDVSLRLDIGNWIGGSVVTNCPSGTWTDLGSMFMRVSDGVNIKTFGQSEYVTNIYAQRGATAGSVFIKGVTGSIYYIDSVG